LPYAPFDISIESAIVWLDPLLGLATVLRDEHGDFRRLERSALIAVWATLRPVFPVDQNELFPAFRQA